jgi:hypothetical protein
MGATRSAVAVLVGFVLVAYAGCTLLQWRWYLGLLPAEIEVDGVVSVAASSGFREGCGAAVFSLSRDSLDQLRAEGVAALSDAHQARHQSEAYFAFGAWRETPRVGGGETFTDTQLVGMQCGGLDPELEQRITGALARPGSYYASAQESILIVIPALEMVVLSFFG